jgi:hypothetical protein
MFFAKLAELLELKAILQLPLVLRCVMRDALTLRAFEFCETFL